MIKEFKLEEITIEEVNTILKAYNLTRDNIEYLFDLIYEQVIMKYDDSFVKENRTADYNITDIKHYEQVKQLISEIDKVYWSVDGIDSRIENLYEYKKFSHMKQSKYEVIIDVFKVKYEQRELWDIFLSHSYADRNTVYGVYLLLTLKHQLRVYVDWIVDRNLKRSSVTKMNVRTLQLRMHQCKSLVVVKTKNYKSSVWVPWEVGYFNGTKNTVAILGVKGKNKLNYRGVEYYSLYNLVLLDRNRDALVLCKGTLRKIEDLSEFRDWCNLKPSLKVVNQ